jgi:hypothetical protein
VVPMIGVNQIAVRTVGQVFIAKNEINFLAGKHFVSLGPRRAGDHIRGKAIERANENLANFQLTRKEQNANLTLCWSILWRVVNRPRRLGVCKEAMAEITAFG